MKIMKKIRIMIIEDHELVRKGLIMLFQAEDDMEIVSEAENGEEIAKKVIELNLDVIILDIRLVGKDGTQVCKEIKEMFPHIKIMMLTSYSDPETIQKAIESGADGYMLKNSKVQTLVESIRKLVNGEPFFQNEIAMALVQYHRERKVKEFKIIDTLTEREREVLQLVADGLTNKEIGRKLFISENTVRTYISNILNKLGVTNRTEATRLYWEEITT